MFSVWGLKARPLFRSPIVLGNLTTVTNPRNHSRTLEYTSPQFWAPWKITNEASLVEEYTYDLPGTGKLRTVKGWNNEQTTYTYDEPLDRLTNAALPASGSITHSYVGNTITTTTAQNSCGRGTNIVTTRVVDGFGRDSTLTRTDGTGSITTMRKYDGLGRLWQVSNPYRSVASVWTTYGYDGLNRMTSIAAPNGTTTMAPAGKTTTVTDPASIKRKLTHDALGRLTSVEENPGATPARTTSYLYDGADRLTQVTQGTQTRSFVYDTMGWLRSASNPESGLVQYTAYDGNGNLNTRLDARSITTTYAYDPLNRMTSATSTNGDTPARTWSYGPSTDAIPFKGRLRSATAANSSITEFLDYDGAGRVLQSKQTTGGWPYTLSYNYNQAGGLETLTLPSGRTVKTCYDGTGQPDQVTGTSPWTTPTPVTYASSVNYEVTGAVKAITLPNGVTDTRACDPNTLQPTGTTVNPTAGGTGLLSLGLCYTCGGANNGNIRQQTITIPGAGLSWTQSYTYDPFNRIKTAGESGSGTWSQTYDYDGFDNRAVTAGWVPRPAWTPQSLTFTAANNRWPGATYDTAGNVTSVTGQAGTAMSYDGEQRMRSGGGAVYYYDAEGRRAAR